MPVWQIILWILLFAVLTAVLYVWGLKKSMTQQQDLTTLLYQRGANRVLKLLKKAPSVTAAEVEEAVKGLKASQFYSKNKAVVTDAADFTKMLLDSMVKQSLLQQDASGNYMRGSRKH